MKRTKQSGFSLIEMSVVLLIISIVTAGGLTVKAW
jgi:prepilin-type N-terminal cleavage/methylation domain-containing protein